MDEIVLDLFEQTTDGVCGVDREQRIVKWNRAAESLLGFREEEMLGRRCFEVFNGLDENGGPVCGRGCPLFGQALRNEVVPTKQLRVRARDGEERWLSVTTIPMPARWQTIALLVHLFRDVSRAKTSEGALELMRTALGRLPAPVSAAEDATVSQLTQREIEVLRQLTSGKSTHAIANALFVSPSTVRNHIHNIFEKFDVHSRLEAVMFAARRGLV